MINLVVQRTFNGLKTDYKSEELHFSNNDLENIFGDEQNAAQLANSSLIYTVENQDKHRVYSYINTSVSDNAGRAGYYAIRLLIPKDKILVNLNSIFNKISQHYEHYFEQKDLANQSYSELLAAIITQNCLLDKSVLTGSKKDGVFYLKYAANERVDDTMNEDSTYLVKKLYLFTKEKSKSDEIIQQSLFKSFAGLSSQIKQVKVTNPDRYLKEIKVNGKILNLPQTENFNIYLLASDKLTYSDFQDKKEKSLTGTSLNVLKPKPKYIPPVYPQEFPDKSKGFGLGSMLAASLGALLIGGGIGWGITDYFASKEIKSKDFEIADLQQRKPLYFTLDGVAGDLVFDGKNIDDLTNYKFKYNSKSQRWEYDEGYQTFKNLDSSALQEIITNKSFDESTFIDALQKISGKTIDFTKENKSSESANSTNIPSNKDENAEKTNDNLKNEQPKPKPTNSSAVVNSQAQASGKIVNKKVATTTPTPPKTTESQTAATKTKQPTNKASSSSNDDPINSVNTTIKK